MNPTLVTLYGESENETMGVAPIVAAIGKGIISVIPSIGKAIRKRRDARKAKEKAQAAAAETAAQQAAINQAAQIKVLENKKMLTNIAIIAGVAGLGLYLLKGD